VKIRDAVVLGLAVPLLFGGLGLSLLDPDEGLYADIAATMLRRGDLVLPRFNELPYLEKPPLYFWLAAAGFAAAGPAEWALRGWSALAALGSVLLTWRIGALLHGPAAGWRAALVLLTTAGYALYVRKASTDLLFVFVLALALYGFLRDVERPGRARFLWFYVASALALLAKGLAGLVFPVLVVGATLLHVRRLGLADLNLARGAAVFAAVALPWHVVVAWRAPEAFWFYVVDNQLLRFLAARGVVEDDVPLSTLGFLAVTCVWLFPWSPFVLARPAPAGEAAPLAAWRSLAPIWALVVVGFFCLSRSKLEYYALPAFPALAVLVGAAWTSSRTLPHWMAAGTAIAVAVGSGVLWLGWTLTPGQALEGLAALNVYYRILREQQHALPFESARPFAELLGALGLVLVAGWGAAAVCFVRGWRRAAFGALVGVGALIAVLIVQLLEVVEPHHSARAVADAVVARAGAADVVVHDGSLEYSAALPFYTGRRIVAVNGTRGDLEYASGLPEGRPYFVDTAGFLQLWGGSRRVFLVSPWPPQRAAVVALPAASVHLLGRFGSRWLYSNRAG
jgi:4-amino-4-deoxy-L-arabinose transferase-like glycosyltransferase